MGKFRLAKNGKEAVRPISFPVNVLKVNNNNTDDLIVFILPVIFLCIENSVDKLLATLISA